jgi:hypothetical protein
MWVARCRKHEVTARFIGPAETVDEFPPILSNLSSRRVPTPTTSFGATPTVVVAPLPSRVFTPRTYRITMATITLMTPRATAPRATLPGKQHRDRRHFGTARRVKPSRVPVARASSRDEPQKPADPIRDAVNASTPVPVDVSPDEFAQFYGLLQCTDVAEVEKKALAMIEEGKLTEGVLKAGFATLEQAQARGDEKVIPTLTGLCQYLLEMYQRLAAPPALVLVDQFVQIINDEEKCKSAMRKALLAEDAPIPLADFLEAVAGFLVAIEQQDVEFEKDFETMGDKLTPTQTEQITQMRAMRVGAKAQMVQVETMAKSLQ